MSPKRITRKHLSEVVRLHDRINDKLVEAPAIIRDGLAVTPRLTPEGFDPEYCTVTHVASGQRIVAGDYPLNTAWRILHASLPLADWTADGNTIKNTVGGNPDLYRALRIAQRQAGA